MNINIKTTNISLTPAVSEYTSKRLGSIEKFFKNDPTCQCDIELARTTVHHRNGDIFKAEIHIIAKEKDLYATSEESDLYKAIDAVKDEILREVRSTKAKKISLLRRSGAKVKNIIKGLWPGYNK